MILLQIKAGIDCLYNFQEVSVTSTDGIDKTVGGVKAKVGAFNNEECLPTRKYVYFHEQPYDRLPELHATKAAHSMSPLETWCDGSYCYLQ